MSNAYDEFTVDESNDSGGGQLRTKLEAAIKALKEKDKQIDLLTKQGNERSIDDYLTKNKVPEKFHKLAKRELKDGATEETFKAFVEEYGDLWVTEEVTPEVLPDEQVEQLDVLGKIEKARQEAFGMTKGSGFKMPSQHDLARMNPNQLNTLMAQMLEGGKS